MAVSRAVEVDIERYNTGAAFGKTNWYADKSRLTLKEGMVEFGSLLKISLEDLKLVVAILDEPNKQAAQAWKPKAYQVGPNTGVIYRNLDDSGKPG